MQAYLINLAVLWICVALQSAWPFWLRIGGEPPSLAVAAVACTGLLRGPGDGCLAGLVAAILLAGTAHLPVGGLFVGLMVVGAGAGLLRGSLFAERALVAVLIAALGVIVAEFLNVIFNPPPEFLVWLRCTLSSALFTALLAPLVFLLLLPTHRRKSGI